MKPGAPVLVSGLPRDLYPLPLECFHIPQLDKAGPPQPAEQVGWEPRPQPSPGSWPIFWLALSCYRGPSSSQPAPGPALHCICGSCRFLMSRPAAGPGRDGDSWGLGGHLKPLQSDHPSMLLCRPRCPICDERTGVAQSPHVPGEAQVTPAGWHPASRRGFDPQVE